ncbi:MAG: CotH kinase family protein [Oscillospiraceae bacterium]|nr:CotH kinase family protein [Oscillospiraceae bacterium]
MKTIGKRLIAIFCLAALLLGCAGCDGIGLKKTAPPTEEELLYESLFDIHNKISLDLRMETSEIAKMQADFDEYSDREGRSPIYRMADLVVTITTPEGKESVYTIEQVGVRMKGTVYSRIGFYSKEKGIYNLVHLKLSFQETFDNPDFYGAEALTWTDEDRQARKDRTFATLEKLDLKWNRSDDPTYIRDNYSSMIYQSYGILSPRGNLTTFTWGGLHMGVYLMTETVDQIFLERYLPAKALGGDLYKCAYLTKFDGNDTIGIEDDVAGEFYAFDLKTNKKTSDHSSLNRLLSMLNDGIPTKEEFAELVDMDYWLTFNAVAYFLGDGDDMRDDYNNFYIYFRADTGKAIFIPHDFDRGLGCTGGHLDAHNTMTEDSPFTTIMGWFGEKQKNPLFLYSICQGGYYVEEYAAKLKEVASCPLLTNEEFNKYYYIAENYYKDDAKPGKVFECVKKKKKSLSFDLNKTAAMDNKANSSFADYIEVKMANFRRFMENVENYTGGPFRFPTGYYLITDFVDWKVLDTYELGVLKSGEYGLEFTARRAIRLKIYDSGRDMKYGCSRLDEASPLGGKDNFGNITLPAGSYTITIHPKTRRITITANE